MQKSTVFSLVAAAVVGVIVGYLLQGFLRRGQVTIADPPPFIQDTGAAKTEFTPEELKGFCCIKKGEPYQESASDEVCLGGGGYAFAYSEADIKVVCAPRPQ